MLKFLDNVPFVILMGATGAIAGGIGVMLLNGDSSLAGLVSAICAFAGFLGGAVMLRRRGLRALATMAQVADADET